MSRRPVTMRVEGLRELDKALAELPKSAAKATLRRVLKKAGKPIAIKAASLAPVDTANLALSIDYATRKPHDHEGGRQAFGRVMRAGGSRDQAIAASRAASANNAFAEAFVGPGRHPQAIMQEFGTVHHGPQPFMRPAWDATKGKALQIIIAELAGEIRKAATRLARKKARAAAKAAQ